MSLLRTPAGPGLAFSAISLVMAAVSLALGRLRRRQAVLVAAVAA